MALVTALFLPAFVTDESVRTFFSACGPVSSVALVPCANNTVTATVGYSSPQSAQRAIQSFHLNYVLGGSVQVVAAPTQSTDEVGIKVFVGDLPERTTLPEIQALFSSVGELCDSILLPPKGTSGNRCGFVKYTSKESASAAIQHINGTEFNGQKIVVRLAGRPETAASPAIPVYVAPQPSYLAPTPKRTFVLPVSHDTPTNGAALPEGKLFVGSVPANIDDAGLHQLFIPYGAVQEAVLLSRPGINGTRCGFVKYYDPNHAQMAIQALSGYMDMVVRPAESKGQKQNRYTPY